MKDSHRIIVESRKVKYDFVIHRNITVITDTMIMLEVEDQQDN